jgi:hypothetical protein
VPGWSAAAVCWSCMGLPRRWLRRILGLAEATPAWLAALIVALALFAAAAVMGVMGRRKIERATPLVPEETVQSVKADIDELKEGVRR